MQKSESSEQKSPNSDHTHTQTLHTPPMNMQSMHGETTSTTLPNPEELPNPLISQKTEQKRTPLPGPSIPTSEKSDLDGSSPKRSHKKTIIEAELVDPGALSPAHEKKAQLLAATYAQIGLLAMSVNPTAGKIIYMSAIDRAREVLRVARHHPPMMKAIDNIINGNDYLTAILGHVGMLGMILALSGRLPENPMTASLKMQGHMALHQWEMLQLAMTEQMNGNNANQTTTEYAPTH